MVEWCALCDVALFIIRYAESFGRGGNMGDVAVADSSAEEEKKVRTESEKGEVRSLKE